AQMNSELHRNSPANVMTLRTADPSPQYLQVYVLDELTTTTWSLTPSVGIPLHSGKLPAAPGLSARMAVTTPRTRITLTRGLTGSQPAENFLPLPYPAQSVSVTGD